MDSEPLRGLDGLEALAASLGLTARLARPIASARVSIRNIESLSPAAAGLVAIELATLAIENTALAFGLAAIDAGANTVAGRVGACNAVAAAFAPDPIAEAAQLRRTTALHLAELSAGVSGRVNAVPPPVPGSRAAIEAEQLRLAGAKFDAEIAAINANPLPDLAALLRDA